MSRFTTPVLRTLLDEHPSILGEATDLSALPADAWIGLYDRVFPQVEQRMWQADDAAFERWLAVYQALFREQQALIDQSGQANAASFRDRHPGRRSPGASAQLPRKHPPAVPAVRLRWAGCRRALGQGDGDRRRRQPRGAARREPPGAGRRIPQQGAAGRALRPAGAIRVAAGDSRGRAAAAGPAADHPAGGALLPERPGGEPQPLLSEDAATHAGQRPHAVLPGGQRPVLPGQPADGRGRGVRPGAQLLPYHRPHFPHHRHPHADRQAGRRSAGVAGGDGGEFPRRRGGVPAAHRGLRSARGVQLSPAGGAAAGRRGVSRHGEAVRARSR